MCLNSGSAVYFEKSSFTIMNSLRVEGSISLPLSTVQYLVDDMTGHRSMKIHSNGIRPLSLTTSLWKYSFQLQSLLFHTPINLASLR